MTYDSLPAGLQRWLDYKDWRTWTPIQSRAMPHLLGGEGALIVAPTASGKTEAALLPIIANITNQRLLPISLLYVSPLRALINDQARRAESMLQENGLIVKWWHGDLAAPARKKILADPPHALFTTPESLEVILSSDGYGHGSLLGNVRYILIDEIHAFGHDDRGAQLMSLLSRIEAGMHTPLVRIGLSATVSDPEAIVTWMRSARADAPEIPVVIDPSVRTRKLGVGCLALPKLPPGQANATVIQHSDQKIAAVVRKHVEGKRAIVFVNSRADAERLTYNLKEMGIDAMVHHGSIAKAERNRVEESFRIDGPKVIVATSTLELGIDIGDLELVVQIGAPSSASSLLQRLGRSGRRGDAASVCYVYARTIDELPQTLAAAELAFEGVVEPLRPSSSALHVLFHQVLQILRQSERADANELAQVLLASGSFSHIGEEAFAELIKEMTAAGYIEQERELLQIGSAAERDFGALNYRDFYSVFETETEWTVRTNEQTIGTLSRTFPVAKGRETFLLLSGRAWRVVSADLERLVLLVEPAKNVNVPTWHSGGPGASFEVMQRAYALLCGSRGQLETEVLSNKMADGRRRASDGGWKPGTIVLGLDEEGVFVTTYFGNYLNAYVATLLIGATENDRITSTAEGIHIRGVAAEEVAQELLRLFADAAWREKSLECAFPLLTQARVGRFWQYFGEKTRQRVLRNYFLRAEPALVGVCHFGINLSTRS